MICTNKLTAIGKGTHWCSSCQIHQAIVQTRQIVWQKLGTSLNNSHAWCYINAVNFHTTFGWALVSPTEAGATCFSASVGKVLAWRNDWKMVPWLEDWPSFCWSAFGSCSVFWDEHIIYYLFCVPLSLIYCSCWMGFRTMTVKWFVAQNPPLPWDLPRCISPFDEDGSLEVPGAHVACPVLEGRGRSGGVLSGELLSYTPEG